MEKIFIRYGGIQGKGMHSTNGGSIRVRKGTKSYHKLKKWIDRRTLDVVKVLWGKCWVEIGCKIIKVTHGKNSIQASYF